jgi:CheY-like chemotaxis protein
MTPLDHPIRFLLVDDLEENLLALVSLLKREGLDLHTARSGEEALELMLVHDYALALLDVQMPGIDGFELAAYPDHLRYRRHRGRVAAFPWL